MKNFTTEDFEGSWQYLIRMSSEEIVGKLKKYTNIGYLSTIMYKVGYTFNVYNIGNSRNHVSALISMSDGMITFGYLTTDEMGQTQKNLFQGKEISSDHKVDDAKKVFVDWLNNSKTEEYRFATRDEVIEVIKHQIGRWRN